MAHKIALFGYDFPHVKTCDFMVALKAWGYDVVCVLAAPWRRLNIAESEIRVSVKRHPPFHPEEMAGMLDVPYYSVKHNSRRLREIAVEHGADLGIIGGARILKQRTIDAFNSGIINIHPGLIPENRGLDNLKWAILLDLPQAVTSHFIDPRIDAGFIIESVGVPVFTDDTLFDINQRLYDAQISTLKSTLRKVEGGAWMDFPAASVEYESRKAVPPELEKALLARLTEYLEKWS